MNDNDLVDRLMNERDEFFKKIDKLREDNINLQRYNFEHKQEIIELEERIAVLHSLIEYLAKALSILGNINE